MHARRDNAAIPAWSGDRLESATPPEIEAAYFDDDLKAWVLSRHADILAALQDLSLSPADADENALARMHAETLAALGPGSCGRGATRWGRRWSDWLGLCLPVSR